MTAIVLLKLCLVPALIYAVSLIGRRWGAGVAGWISALPIVAGPILLAIALERGAGFAAVSAANTLLAVLACVAFCLAYAWASARAGVAGAPGQGQGLSRMRPRFEDLRLSYLQLTDIRRHAAPEKPAATARGQSG